MQNSVVQVLKSKIESIVAVGFGRWTTNYHQPYSVEVMILNDVRTKSYQSHEFIQPLFLRI